jgi:hypothetical protein
MEYQIKRYWKSGYKLESGGIVDFEVIVRFDATQAFPAPGCDKGNTLNFYGNLYKAGTGERYQHEGERNVKNLILQEAARAFPELEDAVRFNLCSISGPRNYIEDSLFHAGVKDKYGLKRGEVFRTESRVKFGDFPMTKALPGPLLNMIKNGFDFSVAEIAAYDHKTDPKCATQYMIKGYEELCGNEVDPVAGRWLDCTHYLRSDLEELIECCAEYPTEIVRVPVAWSKGKDPDLEAARKSAIWPDAELKDFTREKLEARLPDLLKELKETVERLGMTY